jgi:hypothetical protein
MNIGKDWNDNVETPCTPSRGALQLQESKRSFRRQLEQLRDIDDKAMQSVRTAVVVIGFVVAAVGIVTRNGHVGLGIGATIFTVLGVFSLIVTVLAGIGTYSVTEYRGRLTDAERARLEQPTGNRSHRNAELVRIYRSWLDSTEDELSESAAFLGATLSALAAGMLSLSIAATLATFDVAFVFGHLSPVQVAALQFGIAVAAFVTIALATMLTIRSVNVYL